MRKEHEEQVRATLRYRNQTGVFDIRADVREFVARHGVTVTKDIALGEVRGSRWGPKKLSGAALDYQFNTGELLLAEKHGAQKYFDLTGRIIGTEAAACNPDMSQEDFYDWYTERRIQSVGMLWNKSGGAWQGHFVSEPEIRSAALHSLEEKGRVGRISVDGIGEPLYVSAAVYRAMDIPSKKSYVRFLAPLDNILWDRNLTEELFSFSYRWEVYTPAPKRKFGYYVLPVLYNGRFVARFEAEPMAEAGEFRIKNWCWEAGVHVDGDMLEQIASELERFARFLQTGSAECNMALLRAL